MKRSNSMTMSLRSVNLGLLLGVIAGVCDLSATTLYVGSCKPGGYSTIQAAINAAPAGATVQVCPGYYTEQVSISRAVTLEGISSNNGDNVEIDPPSSGLTQNTTSANGDGVAAQVLVQNSSGPISISNIVVNGSSNKVPGCPPLVAGIFYQNSSGTVKEVMAYGQIANGCGVGIWLEGGSSNPSVTVENSSASLFDYTGILAETNNQPATELTAKITGNLVGGYPFGHFAAIWFGSGSTATVTNNVVIGNGNHTFLDFGVLIYPGAAGAVSANTIQSVSYGIRNYADRVPITSNKVYGADTGIDLKTSVAAIKSNSIFWTAALGAAIEFNCNANPNVLSNMIGNSNTGVGHVPSAVTTKNTYYSVSTIRTGGC